jgi:hypothetical protein
MWALLPVLQRRGRMRGEMSVLTRGLAVAVAGIVCVSGLRAQSPAVAVLPVQGAVSMVTVSGTNVAVQIGKTGVLLVDAPAPDAVPAMMIEIRQTHRQNPFDSS